MSLPRPSHFPLAVRGETHVLLGLVLSWLGSLPGSLALAQDSQGSAEADPRSIESRAEDHFRVCDLDGNGWVSFREASMTLGVDKDEFRSFDHDGDGRMDAEEFRRRYERILELLGAVAAPVPSDDSLLRAEDRTRAGAPRSTGETGLAPIPAPAAPRLTRSAPFPAPQDLLAAYDRDGSQGLDLEEVAEAIRRAHALLSADVIVKQTDGNQSHQLELAELGLLASMLSSRLPWSQADAAEPNARDGAATPPGHDSAKGSGAVASRPALMVPPPRTPSPASNLDPRRAEVAPAPERSASLDPVELLIGREAKGSRGPLSSGAKGSFDIGEIHRRLGHFGRLDRDGNGTIDARDLDALISPARSGIRASAIVSALDSNGDGALDLAEFGAALQDGSR